MFEKLKSFLTHDTYFYTLILLLIGVGSFGLGRLSVGETARATAALTPQVSALPSLSAAEPVSLQTDDQAIPVVVSKSGSKYHLPDCPGAKQIKEANRVEFSTVEDAKAAGYTSAANCPGL